MARVETPPDTVLCSPSRRTLETLEGIRAAIPHRAHIVVADSLYLASARSLLTSLQAFDSGVGCAMLIGHHPGIQNLALLLVGDGDRGMRDQLEAKLPTGSVVTLSFDDLWVELGPGTARLDDLFLPRRPRP